MRGLVASAGSPLWDEPSLEDLAGNSLPFDEVLRFTTGDGQPPIFLRSYAADGAIERRYRFRIYALTFNEPVPKLVPLRQR